MAINLDKAGAKITKALKLRDIGKTQNVDNVAWWMRRYEWLCTTEAEEVVRQAMDKLNDAIALRDDALNLVEQLDRDIDEAGDEIARLGGKKFIDRSQPMIEELQIYFDKLFESLRRGQPAVWWTSP